MSEEAQHRQNRETWFDSGDCDRLQRKVQYIESNDYQVRRCSAGGIQWARASARNWSDGEHLHPHIHDVGWQETSSSRRACRGQGDTRQLQRTRIPRKLRTRDPAHCTHQVEDIVTRFLMKTVSAVTFCVQLNVHKSNVRSKGCSCVIECGLLGGDRLQSLSLVRFERVGFRALLSQFLCCTTRT